LSLRKSAVGDKVIETMLSKASTLAASVAAQDFAA
jgi:hypothetical protein